MAKERDEKGRFLEGSCGNPNGRPPKESTFSDIAKEMLNANEIDISIRTENPNDNVDGKPVVSEKRFKITSKNSMKYSLAAALLTDAMCGSIQHAKEFLNRAEGLPKQTIESTNINFNTDDVEIEIID